jgi:hypothetical protein
LKTSTLASTSEAQKTQQRAGRGHQAAVAAG